MSASSLPIPLPDGLSEAEFRALVPADMWESNPQQAAILALRRSNIFDEAAYLEANPDVQGSGMGAIEHYTVYGLREKRGFEPLLPKHDKRSSQDIKIENYKRLLEKEKIICLKLLKIVEQELMLEYK